LPDHPEDLILPAREGAKEGYRRGNVVPIPLSCAHATGVKRKNHRAIGGGCASLGALKKETKAATSCGGCGPLAKQILDGS